ncbi:MAG: hypothetical protein O7G13_08040 [Alphaproteobacteria bacterium]|nr:hypothetical protein [Alphaproteobacteria bacterium]MCZ6587455.1 hypothetical protein [Alphaproteobacteria bacterium]MCZ6839214.1 hypothetical protein [Alphaproteobacteria bacterium]
MTSQELDEVRPVRRRRAWYQRRDILFVAFVSVILLGAQAYGLITGPTRISGALSAALDQNPKKLNLLVTANFPPERFHSNVYNTIGVQRGTNGSTTVLVRVKPSDVRWISKQYWIKWVDLAPPQKF